MGYACGFSRGLKNGVTIAKAVSGFEILVYWHETDNLARVIAKVYLNEDTKIPDSVKVNAGLPQKGHSWIVPYFVLKKKNATAPLEEEAFVTEGPLHPVPPQAPCWLGMEHSNSLDATPVVSNVGSAMHMDAGGPSRLMQHLAPQDPALDDTQAVDAVQTVTAPSEL